MPGLLDGLPGKVLGRAVSVCCAVAENQGIEPCKSGFGDLTGPSPLSSGGQQQC